MKFGKGQLFGVGEEIKDGLTASRCEITSGNTMLLCGCKKVLCYRDDYVNLAMREMTAEISGSNLTIKSFFGGDVEIHGRITDIHFDFGRDKK